MEDRRVFCICRRINGFFLRAVFKVWFWQSFPETSFFAVK